MKKFKDSSVIKVRRARVHNLKNISIDIPKNKLIVITGISGSGKSSFAFDTLYAEGQRRYVESLSVYARQFLGVMEKPDVDRIEGISPAISISQRKASHNPRSTVGTITEIYDYLRLLFARAGVPHCPKCGKVVSCQTSSQIIDQILKMKKDFFDRGKEILIMSPMIRGRKGEHAGILREIEKGGFIRVRVDGVIYKTEEALNLNIDKNKKHDILAVVDGISLNEKMDKIRLIDSVKTALKFGKGIMIVSQKDKKGYKDYNFSERFACEECGISLPEIEPRLFSFNSPSGACPACQGLGIKLEVDPDLVFQNTALSLSEGAVFPWAHASYKIGRQSYFWWKLTDLANKYNFSLNSPVKELPKKVIDLILYGETKLQDSDSTVSTESMRAPSKETKWEGVVPSLERRYKQTDSEHTRKEIEQYMIEKVCETCKGKRLRKEALAVTVEGVSIDWLVEKPISESKLFFEDFLKTIKNGKGRNKEKELKVLFPIIKEIVDRLQFLTDVGLDYLTLGRQASTLAGGEEQRIRLATQIGSKLSGVLYVLDEPSIGLHSRDQEKLIKTLKKLKELGNTVIVIEHDPQTISVADWIIDIGPGAGEEGGEITFQGTPSELKKSKTLTGEYMSGRKKVKFKKQRINGEKNYLEIIKAGEHNLKDIDVKIPLEKMVCITGVSGSGKSSLASDILARALLKKFYNSKKNPGKYEEIKGINFLDKVALVDQSPIGRTPRSNPATYINAFSYIRDAFSKTKESKIRGYDAGRFSFNVKGGRCEVCQGQGEIKIEMFFLPDTYIKCKECKGKRYNKETLEIEYRGKNIAQVLEMRVREAMEFFKHIPNLYSKLKTLNDVGLGYLQLGQPATSLSGGEAQRVKLASELSKKSTGKSLYILDEPTTGLHPDDINKLIFILKELVKKGNTVLVVEHNLDFISNADWIIDLGPEGGKEGGYIVAEGSPENITKEEKSYTGKYLKLHINSKNKNN
jgi:excinuclease ABC subunit A